MQKNRVTVFPKQNLMQVSEKGFRQGLAIVLQRFDTFTPVNIE